MAQKNAKVTLYYSKFCKYSSSILAYIKQYHLYDSFDAIICVDNVRNNGVKQNLPNYIVSVPTLVTPEYDIPLIDSNVMQWLQNLVKNKLQSKPKPQCKNGVCPVPKTLPGTSQSHQYETRIQTNKMVNDPPAQSLTPFAVGTSYSNDEVMKRFDEIRKERGLDQKPMSLPYY